MEPGLPPTNDEEQNTGSPDHLISGSVTLCVCSEETYEFIA